MQGQLPLRSPLSPGGGRFRLSDHLAPDDAVPVTIISPVTSDPFGPGFLVTAETDLIGPMPSDTLWNFELTAPPNEDILMLAFWQTPLHQIHARMVNNGTTPVAVTPIEVVSSHGKPAQLRVSVSSVSTSFFEEETVQVVLDRQSGQVQELVDWLAGRISGAGTGLTTDEHNAVLQTNASVIALAGINPLDLIGDLADAFASSPPLGFGSLSTTYELIGDGEMPDIGDLLHTKLGIFFVASAIPAGFGHRHGQSEEYPIRLVQWRTVHTVGGTEMVTQVMDYETHGELMRWRQSKPSRIEYSITPGVVLQAQWWQFP